MKKIILLTGATGFLGKEVYKILSSRDYGIDYKECIKHLEKEADKLGYTF